MKSLAEMTDSELDAIIASKKPAPRKLEEMTDDELDAILAEGKTPEESIEKEASLGTQLQAGLESFGQAATLGYLPQLQAGAEQLSMGATQDVDEQLKAQGFKLPEDGYVQSRDENIRRQKQLLKIMN